MTRLWLLPPATLFLLLTVASTEPVHAQFNAEPTFVRDVAPLLDAHCVRCHREGEPTPFPLRTYAQAKKRSRVAEQAGAEAMVGFAELRCSFEQAVVTMRHLDPGELVRKDETVLLELQRVDKLRAEFFVPERDAARLMELRGVLDATYDEDLAYGAAAF